MWVSDPVTPGGGRPFVVRMPTEARANGGAKGRRRARRPRPGPFRSGAEARETLVEDRLGLGNDAVEQLLAGRDVVDQALDHASPENP